MKDSIQIQVEIDTKNIAYIVGLMESYDDFAVVRTIDQKRGLIELLCSPDYVPEVRRLLDSLKNEINLRVLEDPAR